MSTNEHITYAFATIPSQIFSQPCPAPPLVNYHYLVTQVVTLGLILISFYYSHPHPFIKQRNRDQSVHMRIPERHVWERQTGWTHCPSLPGTVLILTFRVSHPRKPLRLRQIKIAVHLGKGRVWEYEDSSWKKWHPCKGVEWKSISGLCSWNIELAAQSE